MRRPTGWLAPLLVGAACALVLQLSVGVVRGGGRGFSPDLSLRLQTEALLDGRLALQPLPFGGAHDWAWGRGGLYQFWTPGVSLLRLPGEALARAVGAPGFPDRLLLLAVFAGVAALLVRGLRHTESAATAAAATAFLTLFPTLLSLLAARFSVYEEATAYACLWALLQLALLLDLRARPGPGRLAILAAACGFAPWVRVTGVFAGAITFALGLVVAWRAGVPRRATVACAGLALLLPAMHLGLNEIRFGDPFEFGYRLGMGAPGPVAVDRFENPYAHEPLGSALRELLGVAFARGPFTDPHALPASWPSGTRRFREVYFTPFSQGMGVAWLAAAIFWALRAATGARRGARWPASAAGLTAVWGALLAGAFVAFYLRAPALTSRYLAELDPACAALLLAAGLDVLAWTRAARPRLHAPVAAALVLVGLLGFLQRPTGSPYRFRKAIGAAKLRVAMSRARPAAPLPIPPRLTCGRFEPPAFGIANNLRGWTGDCGFGDALLAVLPDSPCVVLEVGPAPDGDSLDRAALGLRVHSDLQPLSLREEIVVGAHRRLRLCGDAPAPWRLAGLQLLQLHPDPPGALLLYSIATAEPDGDLATPRAGESP